MCVNENRRGHTKNRRGHLKIFRALCARLLRIPYSQIMDPPLLLEQNDSLRQQVGTLQEEKSSLEHEVNTLQHQNLALHTHVHQQHPVPAPARPIAEYSKSHQRRLIQKRTKSCETSLQWLKDHGMIPTEVTVRRVDSGEKETICISRDEVSDLFGAAYDEEEEYDFNRLNMMLFVKDSYNISGNAYHEFAKLTKEMPRHYRLKRRIS